MRFDGSAKWPGRRRAAALAAILALAPMMAAAADSFAIRARLVYTCAAPDSEPIPGGVLVVRDGRVAGVGTDVPADLPLIDLRDEVICPGFVAAASSLAGTHAGGESVSGSYHAVDAFDRYERLAAPLVRGVTTAHIDPGGHRLVSGVGAIVKLAGEADSRVLAPYASLCVNLGVYDPPAIYDPPFAASSDEPIVPVRRQRPDSRLGQLLELEERIAAATSREPRPRAAKFDAHQYTFAQLWNASGRAPTLRIQARRAADIESAIEFAKRVNRPAVLVGLAEADLVSEKLADAKLPLIFRVEGNFRYPAPNLGGDPDAYDPQAHRAPPLPALALAEPEGDPNGDVRFAAVLARRGGMSAADALAGITRVAAEALSVADRVGSLAAGKDADFVVLNGDPLDAATSVLRTYVNGRLEFDAQRDALRRQPVAGERVEPRQALVVRAGRVWVGDGRVLSPGAVLVEDGRIVAVGENVATPPFARVIDAGPGGFVAPGFIDAHGHLGMDFDRAALGPDFPMHQLIGAPTLEFLRVARGGVTTVALTAYRVAQNGARVSAIKTFGRDRRDMVLREVSGIKLSMRGKDALTEVEALRRTLDAAKKYDEAWKKYAKDVEEWEKNKGAAAPKPKGEAEIVESGKPDPITGQWEIRVSGGPIPEPQTGQMALKLTGTQIEGRISDPGSGEEVMCKGTLDGDKVRLEVDVETPIGKPVITTTLDREDHMGGNVTVGTFMVDFEATRTSKEAVEFKVQRKKRGGKDGRPAAPKIDDNFEPYRPLLAGQIPALIDADSAPLLLAAIKLFADENKIPIVLLDPRDAELVADQLAAHKEQVGVIAPTDVERPGRRRVYGSFAASLRRIGLRVAMQSDSEDGARNLPQMGLYAVRNGLAPDEVLRALTVDAAKILKLDDRVGTLEPGRDGDLVISAGHPFEAGGRIERVFVSGREVPNE